MTQPTVWKHYSWWAVSLLLLIFLAELTLSVRQQSVSWDEGDHLYAGYMSWQTRDFGINPEHPPLVKAIAAIPLLGMHLRLGTPHHLPSFKDEAYFNGRDMIFGNGGEPGAERIMFRARMAAAILSLLLGVLIFLAGREMFGEVAALFALALVVFEPNIIAHGAYVTTDMGITCFLFASIYAFYRYCQAPSVGRLVLAGFATGLALASKHSATLVLPIGIALVLCEVARRQPRRAATVLKLSAALLGMAAIAVIVLWSFYGFRYAARPGGLALNPTLPAYAAGLHGVEPQVYLALAHWHLLPESYIYGLIDIRLVSNSFPTYLLGQVHAHGVPLYFITAFLVKSTAAFLLLLVLAAFAIITGKLHDRRKLVFLIVPPLMYLLIATGTGLNIGARHILPMYPFLAVLIGGAVVALSRKQRAWAHIAGLLLLWHVVSTTRAYPVYLAYSNEFWGGPSNTYKYLTDSNTDWGQQLLAVKQYTDRNHIHQCWFAYFVEPYIQPTDYGIPCLPLPTADTGATHYQVDSPTTISGPVFISAGDLTGFELGSNMLNPYRAYQHLQPAAVIQHGVFVYNGTFDNRFAAALGHVTRALDLSAAGHPEAALSEAQQAIQIDPEEFQAQMALGDTLTALHHETEAKLAYEQALTIAKTMEPSATAEWVPQVQKHLAAH